MTDPNLDLQESGWEELRKEARKIEGDLDVKLSSYIKLGARFTQEESGALSFFLLLCDNIYLHLGYVDTGSPPIESSRSWKFEIEIQSLLEKPLDINDAMSRCAAFSAPTTSVTQKLARHRDILHEFTQEFRRINGNINSMREHAELLSSVREDINESKASGSMSSRMQLLREQAAIHGSIAHIDDVINQAQTTRAVLGSQRALFGDVQGKVKVLSAKFPAIRAASWILCKVLFNFPSFTLSNTLGASTSSSGFAQEGEQKSTKRKRIEHLQQQQLAGAVSLFLSSHLLSHCKYRQKPWTKLSLLKFKQEITMVFSSHAPRWLQVLLTEKFFKACIIHEDAKKNEKNIFCLDCCMSICPHCFHPHSSHRLLQIRRYVYHDVIRLDDATNLMDCSFVQATGETVQRLRQFLHHLRQIPATPISLLFSLLQGELFVKNRRWAVQVPVRVQLFALNYSSLDTPDSVLEPSVSNKTSSGCGGYDDVWCGALASTAATSEIVRKKRTSLTVCRRTCPPESEVPGSLMNRRKKTPQRAPLY
ncbi:Golgi SNAP receptor complex member 1-2 [Hibiscus syriacus]|uniref:Golgi SNAP receptor complex member 1-2 n=1 Tax=Hibiscus syriacus TaxID=106335 RepID=A0A6A3BZI8_HIBSY|nr:Golgi SNAP receptor complex member 1-2 [Hibiscus syriacus]